MKRILKWVVIASVMATTLTSWTWADEITISDGLSKLQVMIDFAKSHYVEEVSDEELMDAAFHGMFDALDKHSTYFNKEEFNSFLESVSGYYVGIGVYVEPAGEYFGILSVIEGSPSEEVDVQSGDIIQYVDGVHVKGMSTDEVIPLIKGEEGTSVNIGFYRESTGQSFDVNIVRKRIEVNPITYEVMENNIGYIRISQFTSNMTEFYESALKSLIDESKVDGLIVDLRYNPGGDRDVVLKALDSLLPKDTEILHVDYRYWEDEKYLTQEEGYTLPVVVLVNEWSASASEIYAGTLQDYGRAAIVGNTTYGKGTIQSSREYGDGSGFKITIAQYLTGGERKINGIGVRPDYVIENTNAELERIASAFAPMMTYQDSIVGNQDLDTLGAQQRLNYLGFEVREDGYFDRPTELALAKFQLENGLLNSGILNWETKEALSGAVKAKAADAMEDLQLAKAIELLTH